MGSVKPKCLLLHFVLIINCINSVIAVGVFETQRDFYANAIGYSVNPYGSLFDLRNL